ncbi:MAG: FAD-binding protein, partial [Ferrovibrio sp.]
MRFATASLIPGTAGAAPFQNIGAYGVELADVLDSVDAVTVDDGRPVRFSAAECEFDYRDSLFKSRRR